MECRLLRGLLPTGAATKGPALCECKSRDGGHGEDFPFCYSSYRKEHLIDWLRGHSVLFQSPALIYQAPVGDRGLVLLQGAYPRWGVGTHNTNLQAPSKGKGS